MEKLKIERAFNTPLQKVWESFTTPEILKKWWSPKTMNCAHISIDLRIDGIFLYCFAGADGKEYWGRGIFQKIEAPANLSYMDSFADENGKPVPPSYFGMPGDELVESLVEISLVEDGEGTKMTVVLDNFYGEDTTSDMLQGWNEMFDKLEILYN